MLENLARIRTKLMLFKLRLKDILIGTDRLYFRVTLPVVVFSSTHKLNSRALVTFVRTRSEVLRCSILKMSKNGMVCSIA